MAYPANNRRPIGHSVPVPKKKTYFSWSRRLKAKAAGDKANSPKRTSPNSPQNYKIPKTPSTGRGVGF